jgi:hypothetical protein
LEAAETDRADKLELVIEKLQADKATALTELEERLDEEVTAKAKEMLEHQDADHAKKFDLALEALDDDRAGKLQEVINYYENLYEDKIVEKVNDYLEAFLEEALPTADAVDALELSRLQEAFETIKKICVVNDDYVQSEICEALEDAKTQVQEKQDKINELMQEKIELVKKIKEDEAGDLLESKTKDMKPAEAAYVCKFFEGATAEEISERLDEAVEAFEKDQAEKRTALLEENKNTGIAEGVQIPTVTVADDVTSQNEDIMDIYVQKIDKSTHARR